jgi:hypothetical protein
MYRNTDKVLSVQAKLKALKSPTSTACASFWTKIKKRGAAGLRSHRRFKPGSRAARVKEWNGATMLRIAYLAYLETSAVFFECIPGPAFDSLLAARLASHDDVGCVREDIAVSLHLSSLQSHHDRQNRQSTHNFFVIQDPCDPTGGLI